MSARIPDTDCLPHASEYEPLLQHANELNLPIIITRSLSKNETPESPKPLPRPSIFYIVFARWQYHVQFGRDLTYLATVKNPSIPFRSPTKPSLLGLNFQKKFQLYPSVTFCEIILLAKQKAQLSLK